MTPALIPLNEARSLVGDPLEKQFFPASLFVQEWAEYVYEVQGDADGLLLNGMVCEPLIRGERYFRVCVKHSLGLICLQPTHGGQPYGEPVWVEVFSGKFPTPAAHFDFYQAIVRDLFAKSANLPFCFEPQAMRGVVDTPQPPTPLFTYYFLKHNLRAFSEAIETILAEPHRLLYDYPERVPLQEVTDVDSDVLLSILQSPETWSETANSALPIAARLRVGETCYAPAEVWQRLPAETFDTPENRFMLSFLRDVLIAAESLRQEKWWPLVAEMPDTQAILDLASLLRDTISRPLFAEVGNLHHIPFHSRVLMSRAGYCDLFALWQSFHSAARPLFANWERAMHVRELHHLYEIWVFFELVSQIGGCKEIIFHPDDETALEYGHTRAISENGGCLYYNKTFHPRYSAPFHSYSMVFRPDYVWIHPGYSKVILDAKFSMTATDAELSIEVGENEETQSNHVASPVRQDLYKIHTYRDAIINSRAAVVLYPGSKQIFMPLDRPRTTDITINALIHGYMENDHQGQATRVFPNGIGAIPLKPIGS